MERLCATFSRSYIMFAVIIGVSTFSLASGVYQCPLYGIAGLGYPYHGTYCGSESAFHYYTCCEHNIYECCFNLEPWVMYVDYLSLYAFCAEYLNGWGSQESVSEKSYVSRPCAVTDDSTFYIDGCQNPCYFSNNDRRENICCDERGTVNCFYCCEGSPQAISPIPNDIHRPYGAYKNLWNPSTTTYYTFNPYNIGYPWVAEKYPCHGSSRINLQTKHCPWCYRRRLYPKFKAMPDPLPIQPIIPPYPRFAPTNPCPRRCRCSFGEMKEENHKIGDLDAYYSSRQYADAYSKYTSKVLESLKSETTARGLVQPYAPTTFVSAVSAIPQSIAEVTIFIFSVALVLLFVAGLLVCLGFCGFCLWTARPVD